MVACMKLLTTTDVAEILGVTPRRVLALITAGRLPAERIGRDFLIKEKDIELVRVRKVGRPFAKKKRRTKTNGSS
jgi:excisionase family DNA binding protein